MACIYANYRRGKNHPVHQKSALYAAPGRSEIFRLPGNWNCNCGTFKIGVTARADFPATVALTIVVRRRCARPRTGFQPRRVTSLLLAFVREQGSHSYFFSGCLILPFPCLPSLCVRGAVLKQAGCKMMQRGCKWLTTWGPSLPSHASGRALQVWAVLEPQRCHLVTFGRIGALRALTLQEQQPSLIQQWMILLILTLNCQLWLLMATLHRWREDWDKTPGPAANQRWIQWLFFPPIVSCYNQTAS